VPLTVRSGDPSDAAAAVAVWQLANTARRGGSAAPDQYHERVRGNLMKPDAFFAVAEDESSIVGMALGMQALLREGRARGFAHFQLWTQANNRRAQRLYEGIGFRRSGREKVDDLDELIVHYEYNPPIAM
jgi:GNAT superfamily N-acetyltransferase